jgi:hypothetical protein
MASPREPDVVDRLRDTSHAPVGYALLLNHIHRSQQCLERAAI